MHRRSSRRAIALALLLAVVMLTSAMTTAPVGAKPAPSTDVPCDAHCARVLNQLNAFTTWLAQFGVRGYVGEVGWPDGDGLNSADFEKWNAVGEHWYRKADAAGLMVSAWASGERWGSTGRLSVWEATAWGQPLSRANTQAPVVKAHLRAAVHRGVNSNGGDWGVPTKETYSTFSNVNPGEYGATYHYDSAASFAYLASQGVKTIRLPFRWERVQPVLGGPLDATAVGHLQAAVARAHAAGLGVILDLHNYGEYRLFDGVQGVRRTIGSAQIPIVAFTDVWTRLANAFRDTPGVVGFDIMNEPHDLMPVDGIGPAKLWEIASQAAVDAIRATGESRMIFVPTYQWSRISQVWATHPAPWIIDPMGNSVYETHHYFDLDGSGSYSATYHAHLDEAIRRGFTSITPAPAGGGGGGGKAARTPLGAH